MKDLWMVPACVVVLGMAALGTGCDNKTPASSEGVVAPGTMSADQQKQYADQMKNRGSGGGGAPYRGGPGGPGGGPGGPSGGPGGGPGGMPYSGPGGTR